MSGCLSLSSMEFVELLASESMSDSSISGHLKVCSDCLEKRLVFPGSFYVE